MKTALALLAVVLLAFARPGEAAAQCSDACTRLLKTDGSHSGYGCITNEGSTSHCTATTTYCRLRSCHHALLYTPDGQFAGMRRRCPDSLAESARIAGRGVADGGRLAFSVTRGVLLRRLAITISRPGPI